MDQATTAAVKGFIMPSESITRDVQVLLFGGVIVIAISFLFALGGVPIRELDEWMFVISVPWFALLYLMSRKFSLLVSILMDSVRAIRRHSTASVVIAIVVSGFIAFVGHEFLRKPWGRIANPSSVIFQNTTGNATIDHNPPDSKRQ